jgi:hypothetical protein
MTGEGVSDSGSGEGDKSGGAKVADTFRTLHEEIRGTTAALRYPSSGEKPAMISMLHTEDTDEYTFVKIFDDKSFEPKYYHVKVEDEQVMLNAKTMLTRDKLEEYGPGVAEQWMGLQDRIGLSVPTEEDQTDFSHCFADMMRATQDGTLESIDLSHLSADAA